MRIEVDARAWQLTPDLKELFEYRDLLLTLAYRDLRVRYAQTALGLVWAFFQPLATLLVMILVFGRVVEIETSNVPYPLFAIVGISAWAYFAFVLKESGSSIIGAQEVIRKIYFPRLIIPIAKAFVGFVDMGVAILVMLIMFVAYSAQVSDTALLAFAYLFGIMIASAAVGIWISALTIRYRDLQHVVPFIIQFGLFASPVAYPASLVTEALPVWGQVLYFLNPMAGLIEGFRWCILGIGEPGGLAFLSILSTLILAITSLFYFRSVERVIADLV